MKKASNLASPIAGRGTVRNLSLWTIQVLLSGIFLMEGYASLSGRPDMVTTFSMIGLGQWLRLVTGGVELVSAVLLLSPRFSAKAAGILILTMTGAVVAHFTVLGLDPISYSSVPASRQLLRPWMVPLLLGILSGVVAWGRSSRPARTS
jgi:putative oxidoreductase